MAARTTIISAVIATRVVTSIPYGERLAEIGATPSIGTVDDNDDNALTETVNGYYKTEVVRGPARPGRWRTVEDLELAPSAGCTGRNTQRLHGYLGDIPPAEFEKVFYADQTTSDQRSESSSASLHQAQGASEPGSTGLDLTIADGHDAWGAGRQAPPPIGHSSSFVRRALATKAPERAPRRMRPGRQKGDKRGVQH